MATVLQDFVEDNVVVFEMGGRLVSCTELRTFHGKVHGYLERGLNRFVVDLHHVECTGSEGLGALISAYTTVKQAGGRFVLANVNNLHNLLTITNLYSVFEAYDSRADALRAARPVTSSLSG